mmetsp:Transcript_36992/g.81027  ORF Transcript_36992/g.81027 Transcript_36992/m.81027 type:complete len:207 (+) Transcript_36992:1507-2127(+)
MVAVMAIVTIAMVPTTATAVVSILAMTVVTVTAITITMAVIRSATAMAMLTTAVTGALAPGARSRARSATSGPRARVGRFSLALAAGSITLVDVVVLVLGGTACILLGRVCVSCGSSISSILVLVLLALLVLGGRIDVSLRLLGRRSLVALVGATTAFINRRLLVATVILLVGLGGARRARLVLALAPAAAMATTATAAAIACGRT